MQTYIKFANTTANIVKKKHSIAIHQEKSKFRALYIDKVDAMLCTASTNVKITTTSSLYE